jgi:methionyl-tRNA formyltransferase
MLRGLFQAKRTVSMNVAARYSQSLSNKCGIRVSISRIILLTGETEAPVLSDILAGHNPDLRVDAVTTAIALQSAPTGPGVRLLSFCSAVIVPDAFLAALSGPAYNFHPGPPERPGRYPSVFALYEGAKHFGITVHEMAARVDSGPIVAAEWFDIPPRCDLETLEEMTLTQLLITFRRFALHLASKAAPLPRQRIAWRGRKTTKADCDALCSVTADMDPREADRRRRACGGHMLRRL